MTPLGRELLGCVNKAQVKQVAHRYSRELTAHTLDKWDDEARWRRLLTRVGHDHAQELVAIAVSKFIDDVLGTNDDA